MFGFSIMQWEYPMGKRSQNVFWLNVKKVLMACCDQVTIIMMKMSYLFTMENALEDKTATLQMQMELLFWDVNLILKKWPHLYVTVPPEMSWIDTWSQYRVRQFLICRSKILIFGFHQNCVLQAFFCSKTLLLMVKYDILCQIQAFWIVTALILLYAKQIFSAQFHRVGLSTIARLNYQ